MLTKVFKNESSSAVEQGIFISSAYLSNARFALGDIGLQVQIYCLQDRKPIV